MDCCGSSKPRENDRDVKAGHTNLENNPPEGEDGKVVKADHMNHQNNQTEKEQTHGGGCCCGGSGTRMWLHFIIMLIVFIALWYFSKK